jgi:DNA-binding response OmpR family regulator
MNKPKLLIVDDDEAIRTQLKYALRDDFTLLFAEDRGGALIHFGVSRPTFHGLAAEYQVNAREFRQFS